MHAQAHDVNNWNGNQYDLDKTGRNQKQGKTLRWSSPLGQTFVGDYLLLPITSMRMLQKEEHVLNNNCSTNLFRCYNESYATISIRTRSGERQATLCLQKIDGYWEMDSCLGKNGENVLDETLIFMDEELNVQEETTPTELYYICQEAVRLINNKLSSH